MSWLKLLILNIACRNDPSKVDIESVRLDIRGSDLVRRLQINERVDFKVTCRFTHMEGWSAINLQTAHNPMLSRCHPH